MWGPDEVVFSCIIPFMCSHLCWPWAVSQQAASALPPPPGQTVVWQSGPSANRHHPGCQRPATQGRRPAQEPLRQNLLPPWQKVRVETVPLFQGIISPMVERLCKKRLCSKVNLWGALMWGLFHNYALIFLLSHLFSCIDEECRKWTLRSS